MGYNSALFFNMIVQLLYAFVTSCAGYAPFMLMGLIERYLEERKWKKLKEEQLRMRELEMQEETAIYREGENYEQEGGENVYYVDAEYR